MGILAWHPVASLNGADGLPVPDSELLRLSVRAFVSSFKQFVRVCNLTAEDQFLQTVRRHPFNHLGQLPGIVPAVQFLLSDHSPFITGHTPVFDGGIA